MKCIDAIEGTVKCILLHWHRLYVENNLEDSEYVRHVKAVIDATGSYLVENPEVVDNPQLLTDVLYAHARNLWLSHIQEPGQDTPTPEDDRNIEAQEYRTYYYDYLFHRGVYPR